MLALFPVSAEADVCYCPSGPWYNTTQQHTNWTISNCATLASTNRRNMESWANWKCSPTGMCDSVFVDLGCTTNPDGSTTHTGGLYYKCYVCY